MMNVPRPIVIGNQILPGRGDDKTGRRTPERAATWTPWLLIRYRDTDRGSRSFPNGTVFWASPDITVETHGPSGATLWGTAVAGRDNFVHVTIFNLGKAPSIPTRVDFYWGDPSLGLGPGKMTYIGTEWVVLEPHRGTRVRCSAPWIPTFLNNGHECLMVQCVGPVLEDVPGAFIEPPFPLQPQLDRHVGQRNIAVLPSKVATMLSFGVNVYNPFPLAAATRITARIRHVVMSRTAFRTLSRPQMVNEAAAFEPRSSARRDVVRDAREVGGTRRAPEISARLSERGSIVPSPGARAYFAHLLLAAEEPVASGEHVDTQDEILLHETTLRAFENRRLELELGVPAGAQPGEFLVFHLVQTTADLTVGGYTIVVPLVASHGASGEGMPQPRSWLATMGTTIV
jgi:hypothetical protein